jgi:CheY-like chemotaxis protein
VSLDPQVAADYLCAGSISVIVTDNGPGMSKEDQKQLFGEGVQFNANKLQSGQGSGLGLHFAKGVVELHGGCMSAYSEGLGFGATFTTELPVIVLKRKVTRLSNSNQYDELDVEKSFFSIESGNTVDDENDNVHDLMAAEVTFHNILVVDDSKPTRRMTSRLLTGEGYKCIEVEDGRQCVDMMKACLRTRRCLNRQESTRYSWTTRCPS